MKSYLTKQVLLVMLFAMSFAVGHAGNNDKKETASSSSVISKEFRFSLVSAPDVEKVDRSLISRHYLGDDVAVLFYIFKKTYVQTKKDYMGTANGTEIQKPVIYNSIVEINKLMKKAIKNGEYTKEQAGKIMEDCLCKSYEMYYVDTDEIESCLQKVNNLDQYLAVYNHISFE